MAKKILYPLGFILVVWFFLKGIPVDVYERNTTILTLIGGIGSTVLLALSLFAFFPGTQNKDPEAVKQDENFGCFLIAIVAVFFFSFSIYLILRSTDATADELKEHGVYTTGTIIDGSSFKSRRVDMTDLTIAYKTEDGTELVSKVDITASQLSNYYKGQVVRIMYSKLHPKMIALAGTDAAIERATGVKVRDVRLEDLYKIYDMPEGRETQEYLNNINQQWIFKPATDGGGSIYENALKDIAIRAEKGKQVVYIEATKGVNLIAYDLTKKGITPEKTENMSLYKDGDFTIIINQEKLSGQQPAYGNQPKNTATIVTIVKTK